MLILALLVFGMAVGWFANLLVNGEMRPSNWPRVIGYSVIGSFVGGLLASLLSGDGLALRPSGLIGSIVGAAIVAFADSALRRRTA